ncbi:Kae1-associated serine/threonine protein kinase [Candidatus Woesearchaeota archaeon]|nr:Kae1-associated serine/threonine protein kinase [Candidatus Woesearchaeota archaeon]
MQVIGQGAEAILTRINETVLKERIPKSYRLQELDQKLRQSRTRREAKILEKLNTLNIPAPKLLSVDDKKMQITMQHINGQIVKDILNKQPEKLSWEIGSLVGKLHANNIIHNDLTTSNMIFSDKITLIDFGLSFVSPKIEDKAVDLHLLRQALESKHHEISESCFPTIINAYKQTNPEAEKVLEQLNKVEKRGRNKKPNSKRIQEGVGFFEVENTADTKVSPSTTMANEVAFSTNKK